jgi:hypothetical protein
VVSGEPPASTTSVPALERTGPSPGRFTTPTGVPLAEELMSSTVETQSRTSLLESTLAYARDRSYVGWDLYDGESSRILRALPVDNRWVNLAFQQVVRRAPVNLRPALLVERRQSYLGSALFALANFAAADLTGDQRYTEEAATLVDWLVDNRSPGYSQFCGGHQHPLQELEARSPAGAPDVVSTAHAVRALLAAHERLDADYLKLARSAADFVLEELDYTETPTGAYVNYRPHDPGTSVTLNANALAARLLLDVAEACDEPRLRERGEAILDYVCARQTPAGGWKYRDPPSASHLSMDNFHNGFIVESLIRHQQLTGDDRYAAHLDRALSFYRETLFDADGAPSHDESSPYPKDVHDVAQGIIVFSRAGDDAFADRILAWGLDHLAAGDGAFYQERRRFYTKRITLMRWCQAWMAYALAVRHQPETLR